MLVSGGTFTATATTLLGLVQQAYDVVTEQILGDSGWIASDRFDISAKVTESTRTFTKHDQRQMLRTLLSERFHLKVRVEQRLMNTYSLRVDRGGPKLKLFTAEMPSVNRPTPPGAVRLMVITTSNLAKGLTKFAGRIVVDDTGLDGDYDCSLVFTPEFGLPKDGRVLGEQSLISPAPDDRISIFTAVREQLGLVLISAKQNVPVVIIEDARRPSID